MDNLFILYINQYLVNDLYITIHKYIKDIKDIEDINYVKSILGIKYSPNWYDGINYDVYCIYDKYYKNIWVLNYHYPKSFDFLLLEVKRGNKNIDYLYSRLLCHL